MCSLADKKGYDINDYSIVTTSKFKSEPEVKKNFTRGSNSIYHPELRENRGEIRLPSTVACLM